MPNDDPPWAVVYQQAQRWLASGCFGALAADLRPVLRLAAGREAEPSAAILDSRMPRSSPESGERAGYHGAKRKKGSKLHLAVDTLGHVLALHVTPASTEERAEVDRLAGAVQAARRHGIRLKVVKLPEAKKGFLLLPRRCVVERSFAWATRFLRLAKDYERYPATLEGLHIVAFVCTMLKKPLSWCRSRTASSQRNAPRCPPATAPHAAEPWFPLPTRHQV